MNGKGLRDLALHGRVEGLSQAEGAHRHSIGPGDSVVSNESLTVREQVDPRAVRGNELMEMSPGKAGIAQPTPGALEVIPARRVDDDVDVACPPEPCRARCQDPRDRRADHDKRPTLPAEDTAQNLEDLTSSGLRAIREVRQILLVYQTR